MNKTSVQELGRELCTRRDPKLKLYEFDSKFTSEIKNGLPQIFY